MADEKDILLMDDSEFLKDFNTLEQPAPAAVEDPAPAVVDPVSPSDPVPDEPASVDPVPTDPVDPTDPAPVDPADPAPVDPAAPAAVVDPAPADPAPSEPDYKAGYESIIGRTFKAAGKEVTVKTVEEAIQLMQMGIGFHKNSAKLAADRRLIETLRENGLFEESKINEMIDISKKNPDAIRALVQSAGLEPHQLIPSGDAQPYTPGDHVLPDAQLLFRTSVDSIREQGGEEFLTHVAQDWDVASRAEIYKDPSALDMIYAHKQSGIYDQISSEVERRKVFDASVAKMPFIHAYLAVGNEMNTKGLFAPQQSQPDPTPPAAAVPVPVSVKPAVASPSVTPNPAAVRAAPVRSPATTAPTTPNYLTMSDDEFKKNHMTPT